MLIDINNQTFIVTIMPIRPKVELLKEDLEKLM